MEFPEDLGHGGVLTKSRGGAQVTSFPLAHHCQTCWAVWFCLVFFPLTAQVNKHPIVEATVNKGVVAKKQSQIKKGTESRSHHAMTPFRSNWPDLIKISIRSDLCLWGHSLRKMELNSSTSGTQFYCEYWQASGYSHASCHKLAVSQCTTVEAPVNQSFINQSNHFIQCPRKRDHLIPPFETVQSD